MENISDDAVDNSAMHGESGHRKINDMQQSCMPHAGENYLANPLRRFLIPFATTSPGYPENTLPPFDALVAGCSGGLVHPSLYGLSHVNGLVYCDEQDENVDPRPIDSFSGMLK
jgi:hypothetical protein